MYNLPYVSYGIFAFVLAAVGLLAWKKGFRAALASLVLTLATIGIILGLTLILFDKISPLFNSYLEKHFSGAGGYDYKILANAAKPQIIGVCIAVGFIPVFGCLFGITYPVYRFMKKKDFPITLKKLSPNSKKIKTSNGKFNKIGAITATSVTAILTAGVATSATGVAFTTASSYNLFNDAMSLLSYGTTYGFTKDTYSLHRMYDIIPLTKNQALMNFAKVLAPDSQKQLTPAEVQAIIDEPQYREFGKILTDSETKEILDFIVSPGADDFDNNISYAVAGNGIGTDFKVLQNAWRPLGNETAPEVYSFDLNEVRGLYDVHGIYFGFNDSTRTKLVEWIKSNGIQKFENTEANRIVENKTKELAKLNEDLTNAKNLLIEREGYLGKFRTQKDDAVAKAKDYFASAVKSANEYNNKISSSGAIAKNQSDLDKAVKDRESKKSVRDIAGDAFEQYTGYAQSNDINSAPTNPGQVVNNVAPLQSKIQELNAKKADFENQKLNNDQRESRIKDLNNSISDANTKLTSLSTQLTAKTTEQSNADQQVINAHNSLTTAETKFNNATAKKGETQNALNGLKSELQTLEGQNPVDQSLVAGKKKEISDKEEVLAADNNAVKTATENQMRANDSYQKALADQTKLNGEYNELSRQISDLTNTKTNDENTRTTLEQEVSTWNNTTKPTFEREVADLTKQVNNAQIEAERLFGIYKNQWDEWKPAQSLADTLILAQAGRINDANNTLKSLKAAVDGYNDQIGIVEYSSIQQGLLEWKANKFSETISGIGIDSTLKGELNSLPDMGITFNNNTGQYTINQSEIKGNQTPSDHVIQADLTQTQPDTTLRKDPDDSAKSYYEFSIPYLNAKKDGSHNEITIDVNNSLTLGGKPAPISTKNIETISLSTEGKIAVLEFNKKQNEEETKNYLIPYRDEKKIEFDKNVNEYLEILDKHLGVDPNKKP